MDTPKRRNKVKPTEKQIRAVAIAVQEPDKPLGQVMREAGYSKETSRTPSREFLGATGTLTVLEEFRAVAHSRLNNEKIVSTVEEMMGATKINNSHTEPDKIIPDWQARAEAVKLSLKMRNLEVSEPQGNTFIQQNFGGLKDQYSKGGE